MRPIAAPILADFSNVLPASPRKITLLASEQMVLPAGCRQHVGGERLILICLTRRDVINFTDKPFCADLLASGPLLWAAVVLVGAAGNPGQ